MRAGFESPPRELEQRTENYPAMLSRNSPQCYVGPMYVGPMYVGDEFPPQSADLDRHGVYAATSRTADSSFSASGV